MREQKVVAMMEVMRNSPDFALAKIRISPFLTVLVSTDPPDKHYSTNNEPITTEEIQQAASRLLHEREEQKVVQ